MIWIRFEQVVTLNSGLLLWTILNSKQGNNYSAAELTSRLTPISFIFFLFCLALFSTVSIGRRSNYLNHYGDQVKPSHSFLTSFQSKIISYYLYTDYVLWAFVRSDSDFPANAIYIIEFRFDGVPFDFENQLYHRAPTKVSINVDASI